MNLQEILNDMAVFFDKKKCRGLEFAFQGYYKMIMDWHNEEISKKDELISKLEEKLKEV